MIERNLPSYVEHGTERPSFFEFLVTEYARIQKLCPDLSWRTKRAFSASWENEMNQSVINMFCSKTSSLKSAEAVAARLPTPFILRIPPRCFRSGATEWSRQRKTRRDHETRGRTTNSTMRAKVREFSKATTDVQRADSHRREMSAQQASERAGERASQPANQPSYYCRLRSGKPGEGDSDYLLIF